MKRAIFSLAIGVSLLTTGIVGCNGDEKEETTDATTDLADVQSDESDGAEETTIEGDTEEEQIEDVAEETQDLEDEEVVDDCGYPEWEPTVAYNEVMPPLRWNQPLRQRACSKTPFAPVGADPGRVISWTNPSWVQKSALSLDMWE